jgi:hypothetical protein
VPRLPSVLLLVAAGLAFLPAGPSAGESPPSSRLILIDRPRAEGHPCRTEFVRGPQAVPPGAAGYVVDVCVHRTVAGITDERRPGSLRPAWDE